MHQIESFLGQKAAAVRDKGKHHDGIDHQVMVVKTCNNPLLLDRFLEHALKTLRDTEAKSDIIFAVLDESTNSTDRSGNVAVVAQHQSDQTPIDYTQTKALPESSWLKQLFIVLEEEIGYLGVATLYYLLKENKATKVAERLPRTTGAIENLGGGPKSSGNIALLLGIETAGKYGFDLRRTLITHNDDDLVYNSVTMQGALPTLTPFDFFRFREDELSSKLISFGKYAGVKGSPLSVIESCCHVVIGCLENLRTSVPSTAVSPYPIFNEEDLQYYLVKVEELRALIPKIIEGSLVRKPIAGHVNPEGLDRILYANYRLDQGNFTMTYPFFSELPFPPIGIPEYMLPVFLKYVDLPEMAVTEPAMFHHRMNPALGKIGAISNIVDNNSLAQFALEKYFGDALKFDKYVRSFRAIKLQQIARMRHLRAYIEFRSQEIADNYPELSEALQKLTSVISNEVLDAVVSKIETPHFSNAAVSKGIQRYVDASELWPELVNKTWQIGKNVTP